MLYVTRTMLYVASAVVHVARALSGVVRTMLYVACAVVYVARTMLIHVALMPTCSLMSIAQLQQRLGIAVWVHEFPLQFQELVPDVIRSYDICTQLLESERCVLALDLGLTAMVHTMPTLQE